MRALEKNTPPLVEARALVQMLKSGIETPQSVVALMRIPSSHKRHLNADELWYRAAVEAHFWNIVRPGSRVVPKRPWERPVEELPGRRPVPKAKAKHVTVPTVDPARVVAHVAAHYGVAETDLTAPRRRKKVGVPRWVAVHFIHELADMSYREIARLLGFSNSMGAYDAARSLELLRRRDAALDSEIRTLLEFMRARNTGTLRDACALLHEPSGSPTRPQCESAAA